MSKQKSLQKPIITLFAALFIVLCFASPMDFLDNARKGIMLFGLNVLPVLFPFFFVSSLLIECQIFGKSGTQISTVLLSYLSGYPTGARILGQLYTNGQITRQRAIMTSTYTTTTSPIFIIATVGAALYGNVLLGIIIFVSHILGAISNGVLLSGFVKKHFAEPIVSKQVPVQINPQQKIDIAEAVSKSLYGSIQSIFAVGGLIIIFFIASAPIVKYLGVEVGTPIASLIEMTNGVFLASKLGNTGLLGVLIPCAIVSFGGLCVAMQGFVFIKTFKIPVWFYFLYKVTHTVLSVIICASVVLLFGISTI